jgi:hypothetical protein
MHLLESLAATLPPYRPWCGGQYGSAHITTNIAKVTCNTCRKKYAAALLRK